MKLNMWMIANRLEEMDMEVHIREDAAAVLKSARLAYAPDCVILAAEGRNVICRHEEDWILLHNIAPSEAFELIQGVFDFYQDWVEMLNEALAAFDYQKFIDHCWSVFHNPMILFSGQRRLLAMSTQYQQAAIDAEWEYIRKYGYASADSVRVYQKADFHADEERLRSFEELGRTTYPCLTSAILFRRQICGRLTLIEYGRKLNGGDRQLMKFLVRHLRLPLAEQKRELRERNNLDLFSNLLEKMPVSQEEVEQELSYLNWSRSDTFQLFFLDLPKGEGKGFYDQVGSIIRSQLLTSAVLKKEEGIVLIVRKDLYNTGMVRDVVQRVVRNMDTGLSASLPFSDILDTGYQMDLARYAMQRGRRETREHFFDFYDYAADYLLEEASLENKLRAVHPDIARLWKNRTMEDNRFRVLDCYLKNDRSLVKTAAELFIHRNTLVYQMKKIEDRMTYPMEDPYGAEYMKLSIRLLKLWEKKKV